MISSLINFVPIAIADESELIELTHLAGLLIKTSLLKALSIAKKKGLIINV